MSEETADNAERGAELPLGWERSDGNTVVCGDCGFRFGAEHTDMGSGEYHCWNCALPRPAPDTVSRAEVLALALEQMRQATYGHVSWEGALHNVATKVRSLPTAPATGDGEVERLREALTPSAETKADYIGEFWFTQEVDDGEHGIAVEKVYVPWTTLKPRPRRPQSQGGKR